MKTIFRTRLTDVDSTAIDTLGDLRFEQDKIYKYVRLENNTATVTGAAGDMTAYFAEVGAETNRVVLDYSDGDAKPIGSGCITATVAGVADTAEYVWVQVTGPVTLPTGLGAGNDGDSYFCDAGNDKQLIVGAATDDPICAHATDQSADKVIIKCAF